MKITGTLINYYFHCKRQCWLHGNRLNLEDNSEDVRIGKILHELNNEGKKNTEIAIDNVRIDKITEDYLVEMKKSDADTEATQWQTLLYLKILKDKGVERIGKIEYLEKNKQDKKNVLIELTEEYEQRLVVLIKEIETFIEMDKPPRLEFKSKCKKCAFYEYCFI